MGDRRFEVLGAGTPGSRPEFEVKRWKTPQKSPLVLLPQNDFAEDAKAHDIFSLAMMIIRIIGPDIDHKLLERKCHAIAKTTSKKAAKKAILELIRGKDGEVEHDAKVLGIYKRQEARLCDFFKVL